MSVLASLEERRIPPIPETLKALEAKSYSELPEELIIKDEGIMDALRELDARTRTAGKEQFCYIIKGGAGNLSIENVREGTESEATGASDFDDCTGFFNDPKVVEADQEIFRMSVENE